MQKNSDNVSGSIIVFGGLLAVSINDLLYIVPIATDVHFLTLIFGCK